MVFGFLVFSLRPKSEREEGVARKQAQCEAEGRERVGVGKAVVAAAMCNAGAQPMPEAIARV